MAFCDPQFSTAEHIFEWARNSGDLHARMVKLLHFSTIAKAQAAIAIASEAVRQMVRGGELRVGEAQSFDVCEAAQMLCKWEGDE
jgi:hypothetical protein